MDKKKTKIKQDSIVKCQWCAAHIKAKEWNDTTFKECTSREMKRAFKDIYEKSVWTKDSDHFYKCPNCGTWSRGAQLLLIDKNGETIKGFGGAPIMIISNKGKQDSD